MQQAHQILKRTGCARSSTHYRTHKSVAKLQHGSLVQAVLYLNHLLCPSLRRRQFSGEDRSNHASLAKSAQKPVLLVPPKLGVIVAQEIY